MPKHLKKKIIAISGDIDAGDLAIAPAELETLTNCVEIIINVAASVRFDAPLWDVSLTLLLTDFQNFKSNVLGPLNILDVAKRCHKLLALVHISTAFVNCDLGNKAFIEEKLYVLDLPAERTFNIILSKRDCLETGSREFDQILGKIFVVVRVIVIREPSEYVHFH